MGDLSPHFSLVEFTRSGKAAALHLDNTPPDLVVANLRALCVGPLEWLRAKVGRLDVSSGYRSPAVNRAVGGSSSSQHVKGEAADVIPAAVTRDAAFALLVAAMRAGEVVVDQCITYDVKPHMHVSYRREGRNRGQVLRCLADGRYVAWTGP